MASDAALAEDFAPDSPVLLVTFGGLKGAPMGLPPFEFKGLSAGLEVKRLFVRDPAQAWYQRGLPGVAADVDGVAQHLTRRIAASGAERVVMVGNSMGGYAALLFGARLDVHAVLAFAPQTFLGRVRRWLHRDGRWTRQLRGAWSSPSLQRGNLDLRRAIPRAGPRRCRIQIHYGRDEQLDALHAERLARLPRVAVHGHATGGHALVRSLRDSGQLAQILGDVLGTAPRA
ncbi:MAG: hypothetical protein DRQ55_04915 [Planctomycetota bacterium]|nr:MAG: hypothetical protein DRQ55_04915 [Planctomycetota bacterium]